MVSLAGRCHLVAEEHLRPATSEELEGLFSTRVARDDLERLLKFDMDDPEAYHETEQVAEDQDADMDQEISPEDEASLQFDLDSGDVALPEAPPEAPSSAAAGDRRSLDKPAPAGAVAKRHRQKGPGQASGSQSAFMLKTCKTERSLEKQLGKVIPFPQSWVNFLENSSAE